ncbi:MAG: hypothetical protein KDD37_11815 [Bdellovibrionales bacterium]|nr:hypothetical protein [Bdellovibrionales bacterium]
MKHSAFALFSSLLVLLTATNALSATKSKKHVRSKLSTEVDFNDRVVGGKYQYATESITTVENDKILDDLIGVRTNFSDRVKRSKELR